MRRVSFVRVLDTMRRVDVDRPIYRGGSWVIDMLLADGLATWLTTPRGHRVALTDAGQDVKREMVQLEQEGLLRGCWPGDGFMPI
ncbi:hypothetical protein [Chitinasiproducens palmae]|uniref:Uncharacterized protein n=1 Tax=Chitinasiproducens palmae TaxID=1770053 RepID=A0A1H2PT25_9BURK|nr:hypothetical protein [Chitinasiproducens palmae]SDV50226.1 hypothetical protein SAMN05216551_1117 [Chitinasiproducens palmae]